MLAPLATLVFVGTLCLAAAALWAMWLESGGKIVAALKGQSPFATPPVLSVEYRRRLKVRQQRVIRARPKLRAAA